MANNLTMTSAAYTASSPFGQALTSGSGVTSAPVVLAVPVTVSVRVKCVPTGGVRVAVSQDLVFWIAVSSAGNAIANYWNGVTNIPLNSTVSISDNNYHHVQLSVSGSGGSLYVDGVLAISSATPCSPSSFANNFEVGRFQNSFNWIGGLDEVAAFSGIKDATAFTPPAAPYAGNESGLLALYHLDGNGNDAFVSASVILANNAAIFYSPYNWLVNGSYAKTINTGAYFRVLVTGTSVNLMFDMTGNIAPFSKLVIRVDGVTYQRVSVAAVVAVTMPSGQNNGTHLLEVFVDATSRAIDRWSVQQVAVKLTQIEITGGTGTVTAPETNAKRILIYGDSITEGVFTLNNTAVDSPDSDSYTISWADRLRRYLRAEVGVAGFASQGFITTGIGAVPRFNLSYNLLWAGQARTFTPDPDYCIWLMGYNDGTNNTVANGILALNGLLAATTNTIFVVFRPLANTNQEANLQAIVAGCSNPSRAAYISTNGYWVPADSSDNVHPYGYPGDKIAMRMATAINDQFGGGVDTYPTAITFAPVLVAPSAAATSAAGALAGFVGSLTLAVTSGTASVDAGAFTASNQTVTAGQSFRLQATANAAPGGFVTVGYTLSAGATVVYAGNFVIMSTATTDDITPAAPTLTGVTGATVGQYAPINIFTVAGVTPGALVPLTTGPGVRARIATTTGGALGAAQTGLINVQLGYDIQLEGLAVSGAIDRFAALGTLLLTFNIAAPSISTLPYSIPQSRIWKIGASNIGAFPVGSELLRGPNGGVRTIKDPNANLDYGIDFGAANNGDPIVSAVVIPVNITAVQVVQNATFVGFNASGGSLGTQGKVTVRITRQSGVIDDRSINYDFVEL